MWGKNLIVQNLFTVCKFCPACHNQPLSHACQTPMISRATYALGYGLEGHQWFCNCILPRVQLKAYFTSYLDLPGMNYMVMEKLWFSRAELINQQQKRATSFSSKNETLWGNPNCSVYLCGRDTATHLKSLILFLISAKTVHSNKLKTTEGSADH